VAEEVAARQLRAREAQEEEVLESPEQTMASRALLIPEEGEAVAEPILLVPVVLAVLA
tara:strand:- start:940 stop:1113 length:174 start_codon:yes stop_codon:yes gene_type:complete